MVEIEQLKAERQHLKSRRLRDKEEAISQATMETNEVSRSVKTAGIERQALLHAVADKERSGTQTSKDMGNVSVHDSVTEGELLLTALQQLRSKAAVHEIALGGLGMRYVPVPDSDGACVFESEHGSSLTAGSPLDQIRQLHEMNAASRLKKAQQVRHADPLIIEIIS
jgi:hypothetical protein